MNNLYCSLFTIKYPDYEENMSMQEYKDLCIEKQKLNPKNWFKHILDDYAIPYINNNLNILSNVINHNTKRKISWGLKQKFKTYIPEYLRNIKYLDYLIDHKPELVNIPINEMFIIKKAHHNFEKKEKKRISKLIDYVKENIKGKVCKVLFKESVGPQNISRHLKLKSTI